jgi:Icc-related predicted phosphoesterase
MATAQQVVRVAAIGDVHCTKPSQGALQSLFQQINEGADILLLCGDLTDYGLPEEAQVLAKELTSSMKIPVVAVLGHHDFESGRAQEVQGILSDAGVRVLNGDGCEIHGIGFAGAKGVAGGFGERALEPWG